MARICLILFVSCFVCVVLVVTLARCWMSHKHQKKYVEAWKDVRFVLPDSKNEYLRSRLQTALAVQEGKCVSVDAKFLYVQKLLYALSEKQLSGADSLVVHKLQKEIGRYALNEYFSLSEKENVAGVLSRLLILCAKYEV